MTANQRRPGFRLPWASEMEESAADEARAEGSTAGASGEGAPEAETAATAAPPAGAASLNVAATPTPEPVAGTPGEPGASSEFMRDLVAAMRKVADEAREAGITDVRARVDEQVRKLEAAAESRRAEIEAGAERDIASVGEWAQAEAARIKREAEEKVAARRNQLEEQLAADATRTEQERGAVRDRAAEYEKELEAYHAQLLEIEDPTSFAAAAKRMPQPPPLGSGATTPSMAPAVEPAAPPVESPAAPEAPATAEAVAAPAEAPEEPVTTEVHPAEEEVLSERLATTSSAEPAVTPEADVARETPNGAAETAPVAARATPVTTDIIVKGLGSFGAITGFRQTLAGAKGIDGVALSLGPSGEFVFRATHQPGLDVAAAIRQLEGDGATVEVREEGGLKVTLDRAR